MGPSSYGGASSNQGAGMMANTAARTRVASQQLNGGEDYNNQPDMVSHGVNAMTQVTNSYEVVNVHES